MNYTIERPINDVIGSITTQTSLSKAKVQMCFDKANYITFSKFVQQKFL